jgi:hypothetical protein
VLPPDAGKARRTWCRAGWVDQVFLWVLKVGLGCLWGWFGCLLGNSLGFRVVTCGVVWFFFLWVGFGCSCVYSWCT